MVYYFLFLVVHIIKRTSSCPVHFPLNCMNFTSVVTFMKVTSPCFQKKMNLMLYKWGIYRVIIFIRIDLNLKYSTIARKFFSITKSFWSVPISLSFSGEIEIETGKQTRWRGERGEERETSYLSVFSEVLLVFCFKYQHHELSLKLRW